MLQLQGSLRPLFGATGAGSATGAGGGAEAHYSLQPTATEGLGETLAGRHSLQPVRAWWACMSGEQVYRKASPLPCGLLIHWCNMS